MIINQIYKPDTEKCLSWDELKVSDVFYHIHTKDVCMKTSKNSYVSFINKKYHTRSKLLQGSHSKVYYQISAKFIFNIDLKYYEKTLEDLTVELQAVKFEVKDHDVRK